MIGAERRRRSLAYDLKTRVAAKPTLALPLARFRHHGVVLSDATQVVIEGYPRSANSFSVVAFEVAQGRRTSSRRSSAASPPSSWPAIRRRPRSSSCSSGASSRRRRRSSATSASTSRSSARPPGSWWASSPR